MYNNWIIVEDEELTVRKYLKILKKMFKERDLLDKKIETTYFNDTALLWIEDKYGHYGTTCWTYGINRDNDVIVTRR